MKKKIFMISTASNSGGGVLVVADTPEQAISIFEGIMVRLTLSESGFLKVEEFLSL